MSKMQKIIITLIILVIILIIAILIFMLLTRINVKPEDEYTHIEEIETQKEMTTADTRNNFYLVKDCINKYYTYCSIVSDPVAYYGELEQSAINEAKTENAKIVYNMLDTEYINFKKINLNNITEMVEKVSNSNINIISMSRSEKSTDRAVYMVKGTLRDKVTSQVKSFQIAVKIDVMNETFSILPQDYVTRKDFDIAFSEEIKLNKNNKYTFKSVSDSTYAIDMFDQYKEEIAYNQEEIYNNKLDETYKKAKFNTLNEFKEYAKNRYTNPNTLKLESYSKTKKENYTEYILLDANGDYYIFQETAPMKYTLILDTYTIDIPEFIARYDNSNPQEKVILNINKFMQALNDKDYKYAYSVLADSFKQNNFKTQAEFEAYAKTNFFEKNEFTYEKFGSEANTYYTYQIKVTDKTKAQNKEITKTFIVLLEER